MQLNEMIYKRKSVRKYTGEPVSADILRKIEAFFASATPLYPEIRVGMEFVTKDEVKCIFPWTTPQMLAVFSEEKEGWLENAGFIFQQVELYLQSLGLGACWLGMGRLDPHAVKSRTDGLQFVILLAFGHPQESPHRAPAQFKRKSLTEISDLPDTRLEPARLAPSSVNSQPWYFVHEGDVIHAYCAQGFFKAMALGSMNRIDMGIALAHLYAENPETFRFFKSANAKAHKGYGYIGSFTLT